jgi:hypothetical protein
MRPRALLFPPVRAWLWALLVIPVGLRAVPALPAQPLVLATVGASGAQAFTPETIYATFLVRFVSFTEWPADFEAARPDAIIIGVLANRALEEALAQAITQDQEGKPRTRPLRLQRIRSARDLARCHIVFLSAPTLANPDTELLPGDALAALADLPVLTVSSDEGFLELGGHVRFLSEGGKPVIEVALPTVEAQGLRINARLLAIARIVRPPPRSALFLPPQDSTLAGQTLIAAPVQP